MDKVHSVSPMSHGSNNADLYGGIALSVATLAALSIANLPLGSRYSALIHATAEIRIGSIELSKSIEHWITDGLMAIIVIAIFYTDDLSAISLLLSGIGVAGLVTSVLSGLVAALIIVVAARANSSKMRQWGSGGDMRSYLVLSSDSDRYRWLDISMRFGAPDRRHPLLNQSLCGARP